MDILKAKKPEFAEEIEMILEDELQQSIEESKKKREEWSRGIWHYNVVMETYEWTILFQTLVISLCQGSVGQERRTSQMRSGRTWRGSGQRMSKETGLNI